MSLNDVNDIKGRSVLRVTINRACEELSISRNQFYKLSKIDPSFPRTYKSGDSKQAAVYVDYQELLTWYESNKMKTRID